MEDAKTNNTAEHRIAMENILDKFYYLLSDEEAGEKKAVFWKEWDDFHGHRGESYGRLYIWNTADRRAGMSHVWHKQHSLVWTQVLGKVACRITSKILGIGAAERSWADVKQLKQGKRQGLQGQSLKKQALIFSAACIEQARIRQENAASRDDWDEDDVEFDKELESYGMEKDDINGLNGRPRKPTRNFKAWIEQWEKDEKRKDHPLTEARFLDKYGSLTWRDPDYDKTFTASDESCSFIKGRTNGWFINGVNEDGEEEPWDPLLIIDLIKIHKQPEELHVNIVLPPAEAQNDE
jgi:hypothetical protein